MKKSIFLVLFIFLVIGCSPVERSVGFTSLSDDGTELKFHLGTEASISVVKKFDQLLQEKNYAELNQIFSDTAQFIYQSGVRNNLTEFISMNIRRDSSFAANNETLKWEPQNAFSVDLDPSSGGEHVNMMYLATYESPETKSQFYANLWLYVLNGKIVRVNQYNQSIEN